MQVNGKACIGGIIGIIAILVILPVVFQVRVLPALGVIGFIALISVPIILYCRTLRTRSARRVTNVCIHDLELARKLLMAEDGITKDDTSAAAQFIEDGQICVYLLNNISWEGVIPNYVPGFSLNGMRMLAERSDDTLEVRTHT